MESPCKNICYLDPLTKLCSGCGRTGEEIAAWRDMTVADRRAIMDILEARLEYVRQRALAG